MSNTQKRIFSGLILLFIVALSVFLGKMSTHLLIFSIGVLSLDEILVNFCEKTRNSLFYSLTLLFYLLFFTVSLLFYFSPKALLLYSSCGVILTIFCIIYLFLSPLEEKKFLSLSKSLFFLPLALMLFPLLSLSIFVENAPLWKHWLLLLVLINFGSDTFAWFFGKNFGKTKIWPAISPNKTVVGLLGGLIGVIILGNLFCFLNHLPWSWKLIPLLVLFALLSQIGDMFQSKIKREAGIKDSSRLIPGHGGIYDRIDSLLFLLPFFTLGIYLLFL